METKEKVSKKEVNIYIIKDGKPETAAYKRYLKNK